MALLSAGDSDYLREEFKKQLVNPVRLVMFTQTFACEHCKTTEELVEEVAGLSDLITAEIYNFVTDADKAQEMGIDKIPAIAVLGEKDYGIRFYGIPSGYEFTTLIEDILSVSQGKSGLGQEISRVVAELQDPVHIQVFVTPTCPYCPRAVRMAHQLAMESDMIRGDMVESTEFPHLANRYQVYGVPLAIFNETVRQEGAVPEPIFVARLLQSVGRLTAEEVDEMLGAAQADDHHDHDHDHEHDHEHDHDHDREHDHH